jgi:hypothetical protein
VLADVCVFKHNLERGFVSYYPRILLNATSTIPITDIYTKKSRCENIIMLNKQIVYSDNFHQRRMQTKRYQFEDTNLSSLQARIV